MELLKLSILRIYTAEDQVVADKPFYKAVIEEAQRLKLGGGTVIRAEQGFATKLRGVGGRSAPIFFSGTADLPVIVEIVDKRENLGKLVPFFEKYGSKHFLAAVSDIDVMETEYIRMHINQLNALKDETEK